KQWRPYLYGTSFTIITDHLPLHWLMTTSHSSGRLQRWALTLQEYNFEIKHKSGRLNTNADALSRLGFVSATVNSTSIAKSQLEDFSLQPIMNYLANNQLPEDTKKADWVIQQAKNYYLQDNILFHPSSWTTRSSQEFVDQIVLPTQLRHEVLEDYHDSVFGGHHGFSKTLDKIQLRFFWPNMRKQIAQYCHECVQCNQKKGPVHKNRAPMNSIPVHGAFDWVGMDVLQLTPTLS
ncbi:MAG: hypothetical protein GY861_24965, partial [bacterium]|nr:hypothetical protein [bacterium]